MEPAEAELHERVGAVLGGAVHGLVAGEAQPARLLRGGGPHHARLGEGPDVEGVHAGQDLEVVVDGAGPVGVAGAGEVLLTTDAVHDVGHGVVDPAVDLRGRDAVAVELVLQGHLVGEREDQRHVGAVAAHHQLEPFAVALDVGEPHRPPPRLAVDVDDGASEVRLQPLPDALGLLPSGVAHGVSLSDDGPSVLPRPVGGSCGNRNRCRPVGGATVGCRYSASSMTGGRSPPPWAATSAPVT